MKRFLSGLLGTAILIPVAYFSYIVGKDCYYNYVLFPRLKAEDHYIVPIRWQDFVFLTIFWTTVLASSFVSFHLIRFAMKSRSPE
jgi:hypothetical protein